MYGTIARMRLKGGGQERVFEEMRRFEGLNVPGYVGTYIYQADKDPNEFWMAVMFQDRESYHRNAKDPAQHERYLRYREFLDQDPEWHDGEIVHARSGYPARP